MSKRIVGSTSLYRVRSPQQRRLKIPQPPTRPLKVKPATVVRSGFFNIDRPWLTLHRRGLLRPRVGVDPREQRAVQGIKGTLPERIVYKALVLRGLSPEVDFDFQTSLQGGRLELGGILADFVFRRRRIILQVQGPTHKAYLRGRKDEEQRNALAEMGFDVVEIEDTECYDYMKLEAFLRTFIDRIPSGGGANQISGSFDAMKDAEKENLMFNLAALTAARAAWLP